MKLVLITGCLGLIGSHITRQCLEKGWQVYGIDKCTYAANIQFLPDFYKYDNFTFVQEDIADLKYLPNCDYIVNTAAESHVGNSIIESQDFIKSNVEGVKNLLDLIRKKPANIEKKPSNPYSASKAAADMLIYAWARTYDIEYIILRPTNNYGIGQYPEKLIPICVKQLMRGKKIRHHDKGFPIRNWLHSDDTANAVITIIESGITNQVFNIAGGFEQKNIETTIQIIKAFYGNEHRNIESYLDLGYKRQGQDVRYALNDNRLRNLGWKPKKKFEEELPKIVEYYKNNFKW